MLNAALSPHGPCTIDKFEVANALPAFVEALGARNPVDSRACISQRILEFNVALALKIPFLVH